jgi:hypothetical protein
MELFLTRNFLCLLKVGIVLVSGFQSKWVNHGAEGFFRQVIWGWFLF